MSEERITIKTPKIENANITPQPVSINSKFVLEVFATEIEKILNPVWYYSGEVYSGEE